jgi:hypothetical protein
MLHLIKIEGWKYSRKDLLFLRGSHCLPASICDRVKQLGLWRRRRGTRAGCRHSWHPASDRIVGRPIPTFIGQRSFREVKVSARNNAERIRCLRSIDVADFRMPVFFVSNVCHLLNKIDDIDVCLRQFRPNIVCFTETWLNSNIPDSIISFPGYSVVRRDRCSGEGGGVAIYVTDNIQYTRLKQIDSKEFEVLWISLRPRQLPRPINILLVAVIYCPPSLCKDSEKSRQFVKYMISSVDMLTKKYPNAGLFLVGDFNTLRTDQFAKCLNLVQVVDKPTRKANVLDLIFTNCRTKYNSPRILPPVGASDHNCILLWPASIPTSFGGPKYVLYRPLSSST